MPYIITTRPHDTNAYRQLKRTTRRAVATLDEARASIQTDLCDWHGATGPEDPAILDTHDLTESGGTIGPLPDGTVIEVTRVLLDSAFFAAAGLSRRDTPSMSDAAIINAYNAGT